MELFCYFHTDLVVKLVMAGGMNFVIMKEFSSHVVFILHDLRKGTVIVLLFSRSSEARVGSVRMAEFCGDVLLTRRL